MKRLFEDVKQNLKNDPLRVFVAGVMVGMLIELLIGHVIYN